MAFDESLAARIREVLARKRGVEEKKMFGCVCFLLNGNALAGVWKNRLIARLGPDEGESALREPHVRAFDITGRADAKKLGGGRAGRCGGRQLKEDGLSERHRSLLEGSRRGESGEQPPMAMPPILVADLFPGGHEPPAGVASLAVARRMAPGDCQFPPLGQGHRQPPARRQPAPPFDATGRLPPRRRTKPATKRRTAYGLLEPAQRRVGDGNSPRPSARRCWPTSSSGPTPNSPTCSGPLTRTARRSSRSVGWARSGQRTGWT